MNKLLVLLLLLGSNCFSQAQPDVFILKLDDSAPINVSNDPGYDNQPFFISNTELLFAANNETQTDIGHYLIQEKQKRYIHPKTEGGEYSPRQIPGSNDIAAVRLDPDGKQRLYRYSAPNYTQNQEWIPELQVAYYALHSEHLLLGTVLSGNTLDLVLANNKTGQVDTLLTKAGRSIHKVPDSDAMSYTALNEEGNYDIYQIDVKTQESFFVAQLPIGIQDHIWTSDAMMIIGSGSSLYTYDLFGDGSWEPMMDLAKYGIKDISRLSMSPDGKYLAFAALKSTENEE